MLTGIASKAEGMSEMGTVRTSILGGMRFLLFYKNFSLQRLDFSLSPSALVADFSCQQS